LKRKSEWFQKFSFGFNIPERIWQTIARGFSWNDDQLHSISDCDCTVIPAQGRHERHQFIEPKSIESVTLLTRLRGGKAQSARWLRPSWRCFGAIRICASLHECDVKTEKDFRLSLRSRFGELQREGAFRLFHQIL
jgi:hypothetical protein